MITNKIERHLLLGLSLQFLLHSSAMAQSASVQYELNRIVGVFKIVESDYISPVAESAMATVCREGMLQVARTQSNEAVTQAESFKLDTSSLSDVLRLIPFFAEQSPIIASTPQLVDACLQSMFQALDPRSAYFNRSEFEKLRKPPQLDEIAATPNPRNATPVKNDLLRDATDAQIFLSKILDGKYLYLRIGSFNADAVAQLGSTLRNIEPAVLIRLSGMVLDLRKNPGGVLTAAVGIAGAFLPSASLVTTTISRNRQSERHLVDPKFYMSKFKPDELRALPDAVKTLPLLVLVNRQTEAGAEVVAAALQDNNRAKIIGEQTQGYGTVQTIRSISQDTGIKLTTSKLVRPNGDEWDGKGITPDHFTIQKVRKGVELGSKADAELAETLRMYGKK